MIAFPEAVDCGDGWDAVSLPVLVAGCAALLKRETRKARDHPSHGGWKVLTSFRQRHGW